MPASPPPAAAAPAHGPVARRPSARRRRVLAALLAVTAALGVALVVDVSRQPGPERVVWADTFDGSKGSVPTLVRFTADWCPPCRRMRAEVFTREDVAAAVSPGFHAVSVDLTRPDAAARALAARHGVESIPSFLVLGPDGRERGRLVGYADAARFRRFLDRHRRAGPTTLAAAGVARTVASAAAGPA